MRHRRPLTTTHHRPLLRSTLIGLLLCASLDGTAYAADGGQSHEPSWQAAIRAMDDALAKGDVQAALKSREEAYHIALGSRRWEALADVGDASLRLAGFPGQASTIRSEARRVYLQALFSARRQSSLQGVLRVSEAFAALGDREVARQGFVIANVLAAQSSEPHARERVRALQQRLAGETPFVGGLSVPDARAPGSRRAD